MFLRNKKQKFSIRKLSAGAASVLVAASVLGGGVSAYADSVSGLEVADPSDSKKLIELGLAKYLNDKLPFKTKEDSEILSELRDVLKNANPETLKSLLNGMDQGHISFSDRNNRYNRLSQYINSFRRDDDDYLHNGYSLGSLVIEAIKYRLDSESHLKEELLKQTAELEQRKNAEVDLKSEKKRLEAQIEKVGYDIANKQQELEKARSDQKELSESIQKLTSRFKKKVMLNKKN